MNKLISQIYLIAFLLILFPVQGKEAQASIDKRIRNLSKVEKSQLVDSTMKICWDIYLQQTDTAKKYGMLILDKTKLLDKESYLRVKIFLLNYEKENYIQKLDSLYRAAKKYNLTRLIASIYETKSVYYKKLEQYDLSMIAILNARKLYQEVGTLNELVASMQTIADLYFSAGLFNEAEEIYKEITKLKGDEGQWEFWRKRVIRNNLALIDIERGNFQNAISKFKISLKEVQKRNSGKIDSIASAYIFSQLARVYYLKGDQENSEINFNSGINISRKYNQNEFTANLYLTKSKILFDKKQYDSSLYYAQLSSFQLDDDFYSLSFDVDLITHKAKLYEKLGNSNEQIIHLNKALMLSDKLTTKMNKWKYLQLLAKSEYENLNLILENKKRENSFLLVGGITITLALLIVIIFYFRLRKANLELVRKSLISADKEVKFNERNNTSENGQEESQFSDLILNLEKRMNYDKIYLQKDLTIVKAAEILGTNRSYLSKSINSILNINFVTYINNFRIQESIRLIKSGFFDNYKIEGIADHCGFNSRSAFIKAFSSYTGVTPSFFIKNIQSAIKEGKKDPKDE